MKKILCSIFALAALSSSAFAQESPFEWKVGDNTKIKLGGYVRFNASYDTSGNMSAANDFASNKIPTSTAWDDESYLNFDATASRFSLQITQTTEQVGDIKLFAEVDFRGSSYTTRLRQAYVEMLGFTAGYAWSFMSDLAANAPTVDIIGVSSRTFLRTNLVGYRHNFSETLSGGIALEIPSLVSDYGADYTDMDQRIPNLPFYIQHKSKGGHIKVGGMIRALEYGQLSTEECQSSLGWGAQASGTLIASKSLKLFGQAIYGEGINNYINDIASLEINLNSTDGGATMAATPMGGFSVGASYKITPKTTLSASGSMVENFGDESYFAGGYKSSNYVNATLIYAPAPRISLGVEGIYGSRTNFGGDPSSANRVSMMIKYTL